MRSLSKLLENAYIRFQEDTAKFWGFDRYSCLPNFYKEKIPSFGGFLYLMTDPKFTSRFLSKSELTEAKKRFRHLRRQCWLSILRYKYTNYYEYEDYFSLNEKFRFPEIENMPIENNLYLLERIVYKLDSKFNWIVLRREIDFTAEAVYDDLKEYGICTEEE